MERPDLQGPQDSLVKEDCPGCLVFQGPKDIEDFLDWTEPKVTPARPGRKERMVLLVLLVQSDPWALLAPEESVDEMVHQE